MQAGPCKATPCPAPPAGLGLPPWVAPPTPALPPLTSWALLAGASRWGGGGGYFVLFGAGFPSSSTEQAGRGAAGRGRLSPPGAQASLLPAARWLHTCSNEMSHSCWLKLWPFNIVRSSPTQGRGVGKKSPSAPPHPTPNPESPLGTADLGPVQGGACERSEAPATALELRACMYVRNVYMQYCSPSVSGVQHRKPLLQSGPAAPLRSEAVLPGLPSASVALLPSPGVLLRPFTSSIQPQPAPL